MKDDILCQNEIIQKPLMTSENKTLIEQNDSMKNIKLDCKKKNLTDITKISGIYKILNKVNGKYYVGSSNDITGNDGRWYRHKHMLKNNDHDNDHLQCAWNKYGGENFEFFVVEKCPNDQLLIVEQKYLDIAKLEKEKVYNNGFIAGKVEMTLEVRRKMSIARLGKYTGDKNPAYKKINNHLKNEMKRVWIELGKNGLENFAKQYNIGGGVVARLIKKFRMDKSASSIREIKFKQKSKDLLIGNRLLMKWGKNNVRYNHKIYKFKNKISNDSFTGTPRELIDKYNLNACIYTVANGNKKSYKGWCIGENIVLGRSNGKLHYNYDFNTYTFYNKKTNESYMGLKYDFSKKFNINLCNVCNLVNQKTKYTYSGWTLINS